MPTYDLILLLKKLDRPKLAQVLKRSTGYIFKEGGIIRRIDNLGARPTPFKMTSHGNLYKEAHYFIINYDAPSKARVEINDNLSRDLDVVRKTHVLIERTAGGTLEEVPKPECTLWKDMLPPPYREKVQEMQRIGKLRQVKNPHEFNIRNSGFDYYPFLK